MLAQTVAATEIDLLVVFMIAAGVGIFVAKIGRFPYTIALLIAGFGISVIQTIAGVDLFPFQLSHDLILLVLLPPLLFEGAATTDITSFRANLVPILAMAVPGLVVSVLVLGFVGRFAFGFEILISLLFAAMILPTDPVSVLALFKELGAPERLYELLSGRERATEAALEAAENLRQRGDIPSNVYDDFTAEYEREQRDLHEAISQLMGANPELRREELLVGERRLLQREKGAIQDAMRDGVVADDIGDRLLEEVDLKLDRVNDGVSTVDEREEEFEEFWRTQANEFGLDIEPRREGADD